MGKCWGLECSIALCRAPTLGHSNLPGGKYEVGDPLRQRLPGGHKRSCTCDNSSFKAEDTHLRLQGQSASNSGQKQLEKNEAALMIQNHKEDVQQVPPMPSLGRFALWVSTLSRPRRRPGSRPLPGEDGPRQL